MKHVSSLVPAAHLPPFSTGSALIRPELHIYLKNPPPLCCDAVFSPLFSLFFLHIYIFHKKPTCPGGLQAEILTKEKTCSFPSVSDIYPPPSKKKKKKISQKSQCRSSLLINSSDGIGFGGAYHLFWPTRWCRATILKALGCQTYGHKHTSLPLLLTL